MQASGKFKNILLDKCALENSHTYAFIMQRLLLIPWCQYHDAKLENEDTKMKLNLMVR